ncbi:MAG: hypothetical protein DRN81_02325 [Thermoproteota archaeon]|nr:MAG: hypothetical protein DRN81_02325 [Candidatus Korarchaeota archaeon]
MIKKILKNVDTVILQVLNRSLAPSETYDVPPHFWGELKIDEDIETWINDDKIEVNNGTVDLNKAKGLQLIKSSANAVDFDNSTNGFTAYETQSAIEEVKTSVTKRSDIITLHRNGATSNSWLNWGHSIVSNKSPWTPGYDCQITRVTFTNKKYGTVSDPLKVKVQAHEKAFGDANMSTGDDIAWYVSNYGSNVVEESPKGRAWVYDNSSEGDYMYADKQYGFRMIKMDGPGSAKMDDAVITIYIKEK